MAVKPKRKMTIEERAKQFMPFSALKGLDEALLKKEQQFIQKRELCDDEINIINDILSKLEIHSNVQITYYDEEKNKVISGEVEILNKPLRFIKVDSVQIPFDSILNLSLIHI